jgi:hypothetical protein
MNNPTPQSLIRSYEQGTAKVSEKSADIDDNSDLRQWTETDVSHVDPHSNPILSPISLQKSDYPSHHNSSEIKSIKYRKAVLELETIDFNEPPFPTNTLLLEEESTSLTPSSRFIPSCCCPSISQSTFTTLPSRYIPYKVGRFIVLCPSIYRTSSKGLGIIGPHWYGVIVAYSILFYASYHFIIASWKEIGPWSGMICILLTLVTTTTLFLTSCSDPGIVRPMSRKQLKRNAFHGRYELVHANADDEEEEDEDEEQSNMIFEDMKDRDWRYCGSCDVFQPPGAVHCPFCAVCIEGYDHHCPWYVVFAFSRFVFVRVISSLVHFVY